MPPITNKSNGSISTKPVTDSYLSLTQDAKRSKIISNYGSVIDSFDCNVSQKAQASPIEVVTDVTVKVPFGRSDYEFFRPNEHLPCDFRQIILSCRACYLYVGIVRNVIDLMTDFACEDLTLIHKDKKAEAFFKVWAKKVKLFDAAQEFARHFLVDGNVVVKRVTTQLTVPLENQWSKQAKAEVDIKSLVEKDGLQSREIPIRYLFLNITNLNWNGGIVAKLANKQFLTFDINPSIYNSVKNNEKQNSEIMDALPKDIRDHLMSNGPKHIPLDMNKIHISYNKKDTWEPWATPYLISILKDVKFREKLRQAETSALDGVINTIRIWKLGDHTKDILPNATVVNKLVNILNTNVGGGVVDIVWDSLIDMKEYYPPIEEILGSEKYDQVNRDILIGLGVPEVLLGGAGANFSNSWIQLKTLVEKLNAVRTKIEEWIMTEAAIVCKAMGFDSLPHVKFNYNNLQDETVKQKLIMSLLDRGIVSSESVLHMFNEDFEMEVERLVDEKETFKKNDLKKYNPLDNDNKLQKGGIPGKNDGGPGRPAVTKDSSTRDSRKPKIRTSSSFIKAMDIINLIDEVVVPQYMESIGVDNARKLTLDQKEKINQIRAVVLASVPNTNKIDEETILKYAGNANYFNRNITQKIEELVSGFIKDTNNQPNLTQRKGLEAMAWALINGE